jgi:hypothetical protein
MKNLYFLLFLSFMLSCNFNTTSSNSESDKREGEEITHKLYYYLETTDFKKAEHLFSEKFFEVTDREKLQKIFSQTQDQLGNIQNFSLLEWNTFVVKGSNPKSEYLFLYQVEREKKPSVEKIGMIKENDSIKIVSYHIQFDFLEE